MIPSMLSRNGFSLRNGYQLIPNSENASDYFRLSSKTDFSVSLSCNTKSWPQNHFCPVVSHQPFSYASTSYWSTCKAFFFFIPVFFLMDASISFERLSQNLILRIASLQYLIIFWRHPDTSGQMQFLFQDSIRHSPVLQKASCARHGCMNQLHFFIITCIRFFCIFYNSR